MALMLCLLSFGLPLSAACAILDDYRSEPLYSQLLYIRARRTKLNFYLNISAFEPSSPQ